MRARVVVITSARLPRRRMRVADSAHLGSQIRREEFMKFKQNLTRFLSVLSVFLLVTASSALAFDAAKVPDGLYYNGTNVDQQLWTPLVLARQGQLIDPFVFAEKNGVKALEGRGQT